ncbi:hypothetical protein Bca4012_044464 [Brassica carinata]|uniref:Uncharacterized protein n=1 Tax=Brassica oleracea var. oleracea TaxID=109376 RepID=A0A0D3EAD9_BRAOL
MHSSVVLPLGVVVQLPGVVVVLLRGLASLLFHQPDIRKVYRIGVGSTTRPRISPVSRPLYANHKLNLVTFGESGNGITKSFLRMEYNTLDHGYPTYFDLPDAERELWFHQFAQEFNWDSLLTTKVEIAFTKAVAHHYSGCISEWKQKWERNEEPKNINHTVWEGLIEHWQKPETKSLSETTSGNWKSDRAGKKDICPQLGSD